MNASGTVHTAGCASSSVCQPDSVGPNTVTSTAAIAAPPPVGTPEAAPVSVSPRHQMRRGLIGAVRADSTIRAHASARAQKVQPVLFSADPAEPRAEVGPEASAPFPRFPGFSYGEQLLRPRCSLISDALATVE
ncbi:hypothetical protein Asi03nite_00470 [Actinoplanes siamensis]|uniref:Uncharacterized protein n=1 Tax=Actinoplanes siamensis TaxID=1223317 RepID=A0A919K9K3_9ACTN|nr:hypothetical protein Asi03nite_00470 [Actinoplanes siamensis]